MNKNNESMEVYGVIRTKKFNELMEVYREWRELGEEQDEDTFVWDCGEASARESFSDFAELKREISFEDMLELENNY